MNYVCNFEFSTPFISLNKGGKTFGMWHAKCRLRVERSRIAFVKALKFILSTLSNYEIHVKEIQEVLNRKCQHIYVYIYTAEENVLNFLILGRKTHRFYFFYL